MKNFLIVGTALMLTACSGDMLNSGLPRLMNKNLDYAVNYLGYPNGEQTFGDKKIYTWGYNGTSTMMQSYTSPVSGNIYGSGQNMYYYGQQTSYVPQTINHQCTIRLAANEQGLLERWEWNGDDSGCDRFWGAMSRLISDTDPIQ